jgi:hypothetical protein
LGSQTINLNHLIDDFDLRDLIVITFEAAILYAENPQNYFYEVSQEEIKDALALKLYTYLLGVFKNFIFHIKTCNMIRNLTCLK